MLVVQRIRIEWTKASRGGEGATLRNALPEICPLPPLRQVGGEYLFHDIHFREWDQFACRETLAESKIPGHLDLSPLFLHVAPDRIQAKFLWSWKDCGAPERDSHDLFSLALGEWAQFRCNGRFGPQTPGESSWWYRKSIFTIAFIEEFDAGIFSSQPATSAERIAVLK